jgi:hypothetical protein
LNNLKKTERNLMTSQEELDLLETQLAGTLKRVSPPKGLTQRLREKISIPTRETIFLRLHDWRTLFFVFGGVMSGMLVIVTLARAFYHLVGRRDVG